MVGWEGFLVYMGVMGVSLLVDKLYFLYNVMCILIGCGVVVGIVVLFNILFVVVIFVMEVVFREYKVYIFVFIMFVVVIGVLVI